MRKTISVFKEAKESRKLSMVTCYDYTFAKLVDEAGIDTILVGDSLGNTMLGYDTTLAVTVDDMIHHGKSVVRGTSNVFIVVDMPFLSYQTSVYDALCNAGRIMKETGCQAVKLEGGKIYADRVKALTDAGIPVVAHIGLTPQSVNSLGGFKVQGKDEQKAQELIEDALALEEAGAIAITLECVPTRLAKLITSKLSIPTIGIGAGNGCDGQVLVLQDLLGMNGDFSPKFVKKYANLHDVVVGALKTYDEEVKSGEFPKKEHGFVIKDEVLEKLY